MTTTKTTTETPPKHKILREVLRNYTVFESRFQQSGEFEIEHRGITLDFLDLQGCLKGLSPRKKEAIFLHVVLDKKQKDAAEWMGITTVSVGQYVEQGLIQVARLLWPEEDEA